MRLPASLVLLLVLLLPVASASAQDRAPSKPQAVLEPGDSVRVVVWRKPELSGDFVVAPDGSITHPLYRGVRVGGVPFSTAENNLRTVLLQYEANPQFVMEPLIRVAVSGEVNRPQVFALRPETSVAEAVARAGGTNQYGARSRIRVLRLEATGQQEEITVNLSEPRGQNSTMLVRSGDQIVVERKRSLLRDFLLPALSVVGSIASIGLLIDRASR